MVLVAISRMKSLLLYPAFSLLPSPKLSNFKPSHPPPYFFPSASAFRGSSSLTVNPGLLPQVRPSMPCTDPHGPLDFIRGYCSRAQGSLSRPLTPTGEIHVIVGPMFAGKTTALLRRIQLERRNGRSVAMIKSNKDARYGLDSIVTHDGAKYPCFPLADLSSFKSNVGHRAYDELDVIGIDEAQFFGDLYEFCQVAADHDGKTVIVAGLDGDYLRRSFGSVLHIIPLADSVSKLTARCELCGKPAHFTLRKIDDTKTELIGGAEVYMPVCRQHYASGQVVMEATRMVLQNKANSPCLTGD